MRQASFLYRQARDILCTTALMLLAVFSTAHAHDIPPNTPSALMQQVGFEPQLNGAVPTDLPFTDEYGRPVRLSQYFHGKPVILAPVYYTCPVLCNQVIEGLSTALRVVSMDAGKEFEVVAVSFNPQEHPSDALTKKEDAIARYHHAGSEVGWHFLTGADSSIQPLMRAINFRYAYDTQTRTYVHASGVVVLTPESKISRYFYGVEYAARDLRLALIESSQRKIGTVVDHVLLYCYEYNPSTGRYGTAIVRLLRGTAVLVMVSLFGAIVLFVRRDRKGPPPMASKGGLP